MSRQTRQSLALDSRADLGVGADQHAAIGIAKPGDKPPVVRQDDPGAVLGEAGIGHEPLYFGEKTCHADDVARFSVRVNTRQIVRAPHAGPCYVAGMHDGWFERLKAVIEADPRSMRRISTDAGLGPNYVQQMLRDNKAPGTDRLGALLDTLNRRTALYILTGLDADDKDLEMLREAASMSDQGKRDLLGVIRAMKGDGSRAEPADAGPAPGPSTPQKG